MIPMIPIADQIKFIEEMLIDYRTSMLHPKLSDQEAADAARVSFKLTQVLETLREVERGELPYRAPLVEYNGEIFALLHRTQDLCFAAELGNSWVGVVSADAINLDGRFATQDKNGIWREVE